MVGFWMLLVVLNAFDVEKDWSPARTELSEVAERLSFLAGLGVGRFLTGASAPGQEGRPSEIDKNEKVKPKSFRGNP